MNKKTSRASLRAPTVKPVSSIAPSATLAEDGELPLAASNGVAAPAPLAAHDVLQAAMAPREGAPHDDADAADAAAVPADVADVADAPEQDASANGKKQARKPAKAAEPVQEKFVKCTFALPESEMLVLDAMKKTHKANGVALKKSQLLRAALLALADVDADRLTQLVAQLPPAPKAGKKKK
jgi:cytoskeletal protein RodZ